MKSAGKTAARRTSGVTTADTSGIASALASGPATDTWPKSKRAAGARPSATAHRHRGHAPPERRRKPGEQARDQRDVEPGDAHEMGHAGAVEKLPLLAGDRALVAHGEGDQDSRRGSWSERAQETIAYGLSCLLD